MFLRFKPTSLEPLLLVSPSLLASAQPTPDGFSAPGPRSQGDASRHHADARSLGQAPGHMVAPAHLLGLVVFSTVMCLECQAFGVVSESGSSWGPVGPGSVQFL